MATQEFILAPDQQQHKVPQFPPAPFRTCLTPREREVLALMAQGVERRAIAQQLGLSYWRVVHLTGQVVQKLGARNHTHATCMAIAWELMRIPAPAYQEAPLATQPLTETCATIAQRRGHP